MKEIVNVKIASSKEKSYPIYIGNEILSDIGAKIKEHSKASKVLIVSNDTVYNLYGKQVVDSLDNAGMLYETVLLSDGEKYKNIDSLQQIWGKALEIQLERKDAIIALGGGVVGDITGFAASSILRGVDFVQIPTTLLAMVDSSVGGKVAINHKKGKNLLGAFYQPKFVLSDLKTLKTLDEKQLKVGLAEVLKYGFIEKSCGLNEKAELSKFLSENKESIFSLDDEKLIYLVKHCCKLKASVVNQDEKEKGLRTILNFGHTIGHAIEKCTNYELFNHGEAVAMGMKSAFNIAKSLDMINNEYETQALNLINHYEMDYKIPKSVLKNDLYKAMFSDKKVQSGKIRFILSTNIAEVSIFDNVSENSLKKSLEILY